MFAELSQMETQGPAFFGKSPDQKNFAQNRLQQQCQQNKVSTPPSLTQWFSALLVKILEGNR